MWLFLAFVLVPIIEIGLFIQVGGLIGLWPTLAIVLLTAMIGTYMVKSEGRGVLRDLQSSINRMEDPSEHLASGAMILFAGALLLTPGFFTDTMGILLLIPGVRSVVFNQIKAKMQDQRARGQSRGGFQSQTIVVDYEVLDENQPNARPSNTNEHGPSGWTRH
ncbi:FxsA family protein [Donghicola mangrovi]|uniref:FxsA family protein n=1 Tax=Donghicola mangrovi TaxID=2729614 RepID=A0A850Q332_9RHOB|nr:FxsA family protein [Donghicola mangrovi]NVO22392.1 FxsA family protein [Donghicola mangrovi]